MVFAPPARPLLQGHVVPVEGLPQYIHDYQYNEACPCDLQLLQPYSDLAFKLYTGIVTLDMLTDEQILSLAHLGDGMWPASNECLVCIWLVDMLCWPCVMPTALCQIECMADWVGALLAQGGGNTCRQLAIRKMNPSNACHLMEATTRLPACRP